MLITPVGVVILLLVIGGPVGYLLFRKWRQGNLTIKRAQGGTRQGVLDNTIIVDAVRGIYTAYQESSDVIPMVSRNDGREYLVLRKTGEELTALEVPDSARYYDPREYGNVLTMKAHADLFERRRTLFQNIAPWALVVGLLIVGIITIVLAG